MVGSIDTRLIVLRGNSGSGKSTTAGALQEQLGRGVARVERRVSRTAGLLSRVRRLQDPTAHIGPAPGIGSRVCTLIP